MNGETPCGDAMRSLWLEDQTLTFRDNISIPTPQPGEALIRVFLAGVCSTDLELMRGYYPFTGIPGHEFVGVVQAAPHQPEWLGKRVVGEINLTCGECDLCKAGHAHHCQRRTVLGILGHHGAFAEFLTLPLQNLHLVPERVADEAAVFTEPLAAALEVQEQLDILPSMRVLVVGAGRLGQLLAQTLALTGCDLGVVARHPRQRLLLEERGINVLTEEEVATGKMDVVIEATGVPGGFQLARRAVRPRGVIVLKSTFAANLEINISSVVVDEISLIGSRCGPFPTALQLLAEGSVDPRPLIEASYSLVDGSTALEHASRPGALKVLIACEQAG